MKRLLIQIKKDSIPKCCYLLLCSLFVIPSLSGQISLETTSNVHLEATGGLQMELSGGWQNPGTFSPGLSTILLDGSGNQPLLNDGGSFYHVIVDKSGGEVALNSNIEITGGLLSLQNGDVNLNGRLITLDVAAILSETAGNTVRGGNGYLTTTRILNAPNAQNVAGLGFEITTGNDLGSTEIRRGHAAQTGNSTASILRYYDILPADQTNLAADLMFHYDESELNGQAEADLQLFRSDDGGATWILEGGTVDVQANTVSAYNVSRLSRFTLSGGCLEKPLINTITIPVDPVALGDPVSVSAEFTANCAVAATWDWGDLSTDPGIVNGGQVTGSYTYTNPGVYILTLTLSDPFNNTVTGQAVGYIVVYDPNGNYVTGNGWINSPPGALVSEPTVSGKAHFGFNSEYENGASVPTGDTDFRFKAGDFRFRSTSYDWLVIAGENAKFKGWGMVNDQGNYRFMITAKDGDLLGQAEPDEFRIKIWEEVVEGVEDIIYDNVMGVDDTADDGQEIGGGKIAIKTSHGNGNGGGNLSAPANSTGTTIGVSDQRALDSDADLTVFPNPFTAQTTIRFYLAEAGQAALEIFNLNGQRVHVLYNGWMDAGSRQFDWDGTGNGQALEPGIYFVKMNTGKGGPDKESELGAVAGVLDLQHAFISTYHERRMNFFEHSFQAHAQTTFNTEWTVSSADLSVTIPTTSGGYDYTVDWGGMVRWNPTRPGMPAMSLIWDSCSKGLLPYLSSTKLDKASRQLIWKKVIRFLESSAIRLADNQQVYWTDRWNISPMYPSHEIIYVISKYYAEFGESHSTDLHHQAVNWILSQQDYQGRI